MASKRRYGGGAVVLLLVLCVVMKTVTAIGSMGSLAASYGENGRTLCGLNADGSHFVSCFGSDAASLYGAPLRMAFAGLTAGDGFVCGLQIASGQPYCWGNNIFVQMGVPTPVGENVSYVEISAGDHHLCALRQGGKNVDCWGYNMTGTYGHGGFQMEAISAGSLFNCGLLKKTYDVFCWGDETGSGVISGAPRNVRFRAISAGGYHVCGIERNNELPTCWGRTERVELGYGFDPPAVALSVIVGGKFHACGIATDDRRVSCWGQRLPGMSPAPENENFLALAAGDYFTCGVAASGLNTVCWGLNYPRNSPLAVVPGVCRSSPCETGYYIYEKNLCDRSSQVCVPCSRGCPVEMYETVPCGPEADRQCGYNCTECSSDGQCTGSCREKKRSSSSWRTPIIVAEMVTAAVVAGILSAVGVVLVRFRTCRPAPEAKISLKSPSVKKSGGGVSSSSWAGNQELKIRRAQVFRYEELDRATGGFSKNSEVGRGSYSVVFKGVLPDGRIVAVKRAVVAAADLQTDDKQFHRELDLLSRLNHAHLLNLLGYCEENGERLLVYEFMSHGTLHEHLHGISKPKLGWVRRVTIAVQAARGLEYLHGYACPPVIHRDIKSSNILIDQDHNARVADFGLSLLGPADSGSPLSELPAGTLGYLDPEYYRLHYLTTKSDVYSFGVLLLEILSGRKAIDMQYEAGNIVEWAVPLIKRGEISGILDTSLDPPLNFEALYRIAKVAYKCVKMQGKKRPSMDRVTTELERALALLMGTPCDEQPILPTEVVLGSNRLHKSGASGGSAGSADLEVRAPSWITFPSVASSQRRKSSSISEDMNNNNSSSIPEEQQQQQQRYHPTTSPEIGPASSCEQDKDQNLFLQNNF